MNSHFAPARFAVLLALVGAVQAVAADAPQRPGAELVNLAAGAVVRARTSLELPPLWSKEYLTAGVRVVGGYCSRSTTTMAKPTPPDAGRGAVDEWVEIDLGADKSFSQLRLCPVWLHSTSGSGAPSFPVDYTISVKPDGGAYVLAKTVNGQVNPGTAPVTLPLGPQRARLVKIAVSRVSGRAWGDAQDLLRLAEVEVLGPAPAASAAAVAAKLPEPYWRLQTDDTAITVAVIGNRPMIVALEPAAGGWNWIKSPLAATAFPTNVNLYRLPNMTQPVFGGSVTWKFKGAVVDGGQGTKLTLRFGCDVPELELRPPGGRPRGAVPSSTR